MSHYEGVTIVRRSGHNCIVGVMTHRIELQLHFRGDKRTEWVALVRSVFSKRVGQSLSLQGVEQDHYRGNRCSDIKDSTLQLYATSYRLHEFLMPSCDLIDKRGKSIEGWHSTTPI